MKEILGQKIGMTRVFMETGEAVPVTVIQAGPCPVVARRTVEKDGYEAYQVGFGSRKKQRVTKPRAGQFGKAGVEPTRYLREIKFTEAEFEVGSRITVDAFKAGDRVDVTGTSRGLGFQGGMKRHNFQGANKTHGQSDRWRAPGSIGQSSYPSRVFKGLKMAGRMGKERVTVLNLEVVKVIESENLMLVKGSVPGHRGALLKVRTTNRAIR
ncbi:50S ribosomal protein L3 [candidate division GN15 bacterium]|nr:50S ribosomal protein L3 [candidate division GN15 bacterium]